ncbi:MAG TPA: hypothetical protein P5218_13710, partial [Planctomycetota bacterium]|nr:hypothetical protein [Planctomycetota bacterium]
MKSRCSLVFLFCGLALLLFTALRVVLYVQSYSNLEQGTWTWVPVLVQGLIADLTVCSWMALGPCLYLWLAPRWLRGNKLHSNLL